MEAPTVNGKFSSESLSKQSGFTFLALLFFVSLMGMGLAVTGVLWRQDAQREKERELLFVGGEFRRAIALYYENTPGLVKQHPKNLEDLLQDKRQPTMQRYLRRLYRDPITGKNEWGTVKRPDGAIVGVFSLGKETPIKQADFSLQEQQFEQAKHYSDWQFVYQMHAAAKN